MKKSLFLLLSLLAVTGIVKAQKFKLDTSWWQPNGTVRAMAYDSVNQRVYIGGDFNYVGPNTPNGLAVDTAQGSITTPVAKPNGIVNSSVSDGFGGWYIGGEFTRVGDSARSRIAHINAQGQVTGLSFASTDFTGPVNILALKNNTLYAGGSFTSETATYDISHGASVDSSSAQPDLSNAEPNDQVFCSVSDGSGGWYIGGKFTKVGDSIRYHIAHINALGKVTGLLANNGFNDEVHALTLSNNTLYVGGDFTSHNPSHTTYGASIDSGTARPDLNDAKPNGRVYSSVSDGFGGWYIGGEFTKVGDSTRSNIAHINALGRVTGLFANNASSGSVRALLLNNNTLYVGGGFASIGGQSRNHIAALDIYTGLATPWNPNANSSINSLAICGNKVYVGGRFNIISGQSRSGIAALDTFTGMTTGWNANMNGYEVLSLAISGNKVYVGGEFTSIGGQSRMHIAALDTSVGLATTWNPNMNGYAVSSLAISGNKVYVGGNFTSIGGQSRKNIAALDTFTGLANAWNPNPNGEVSTIALNDNKVYVGGIFTNIGGQNRDYLAALDTSLGLAMSWNPYPNDYVYSLTASGNKVYAGGDFISVGGQIRNNVAALDVPTGLATIWNPNASHRVNALIVSGNKVYMGGEFTSIGGQTRNSLATVDISTGLATSWNPNANHVVLSLTISGNKVYAGGWFTSIGGQTRNYIAALDTSTGLATSWNPNANHVVYSLVLNGAKMYAGGGFTSIGGQSRNYLASLDVSTGLATTWNPNADASVFSITISGNNLFVGGWFSSIGGQVRTNAAVLDIFTGLAGAWNPNLSPSFGVSTVAVSGDRVYVGGNFWRIGGYKRKNVAAFNTATGLVNGWNPYADKVVSSLVIDGNKVYAGGDFVFIGGQLRNKLAALDAYSGLASAWNPNPNKYVGLIAIGGNKVYASGAFTSIGGQSRNYLAAIDASTGLATAWNPNPNSYISSLVEYGNQVYVAGDFTDIGGQSRNYVAALDISSGMANTWNPNANETVNSLAISGNTIFVGGYFVTIGGQSRNRVAALDAFTGLATAWNPNANDGVSSLTVSGNKIYLGGGFTSVGGWNRNRLAALDVSTGLVTAWNPNGSGYIYSLALGANNIYVGGDFTSIGGQIRNRLAALDTSVGLVTSWNPNSNNFVNTITVNGNKVYVGGGFTTIGGQSRNRIAALDIFTGLSTTWNPNANNEVRTLVLSGNRVYVGGGFTTIGGQSRNRVAALDAFTGLATGWNPNANGAVLSLTESGNRIYAGGYFTNIGSQSRSLLAVLDTSTGLATGWNPDANGNSVNSIAISGNKVYIGGEFTSIGGENRNNLAALDTSIGVANAWNPSPSSYIQTLVFGRNKVFVGGNFIDIDSQSRTYMAKLFDELCANHKAIVSIQGNTTFCKGGAVELRANTATGLKYQWRDANGNIAGANTAVYTASASGAYIVEITDSNNCVDLSAPIMVAVMPIAIASTQGSTTFCHGGAVALSANAGTGLVYQWRDANGDIIGANTATYNASTSGVYKAVVSDSNNCVDSSSSIAVTVNALPLATVSAQGSTIICRGDTLSLNANVASGLAYQWRNANGNIAGANMAIYDASTSGIYKVVVSDGNNCMDSSSAITVTVMPLAIINAQGSTTFCQGGTVELSANISTGLVHQWRDANGDISGANMAMYMASTSGMYRVVVSDSNNCVDSSSAIAVTVNTLPLAIVSSQGTTTICYGNTVVLKANSAADIEYQWRNANGDIAGANTLTYNVTASGMYKVVVSDRNNCADSSTGTIVVINDLPLATIIAQGDTTFCSGASVQLKASIDTSLTYQWRNGNGNIAGATGDSYTANSTDAYKVVVTNSNGCTDSSVSISVTANALPLATVTAQGDTTFCSGGSVSLTATIDTGLVYQWLIDEQKIVGATAGSYISDSTGFYKVVLKNSNGCSDTSSAITVTENPKPITSSVSGPTAANLNTQHNYNVVLTLSSTYYWAVDGGIQVSGQNSAAIGVEWQRLGTASVRVVETNVYGCLGDSVLLPVTISANDSLSVNEDTLFFSAAPESGFIVITSNRSWTVLDTVPWVSVSPDNGTGDDSVLVFVSLNTSGVPRTSMIHLTGGTISHTVHIYQESSVGLNELKRVRMFTIYPNPSNSLITIQGLTEKGIVYDILGNEMLQIQSDGEVDISNLQQGVYFIHSGSVIQKIVKY